MFTPIITALSCRRVRWCEWPFDPASSARAALVLCHPARAKPWFGVILRERSDVEGSSSVIGCCDCAQNDEKMVEQNDKKCPCCIAKGRTEESRVGKEWV